MRATLLSVFCTSHADTVGNAHRLRLLKSLTKKYELVIFTNCPFFIKSRLTCRTIYVPFYRNLFFLSRYLFWFMCGIRLIFTKRDLLYLCHSESPISFFNVKTPFLCYVYQSQEFFIKESRFRKKTIKRYLNILSKKIYVKLIAAGVRNSNFVFTVSERMVEFLTDFKIDNKKIKYLPYLIDFNSFRRDDSSDIQNIKTIPQNKFVLMYTGWINESRGLDTLLSGICEINKISADIVLVLIGCEDEYIKKIRYYAHRHSITENVLAVGRIEHAFIPFYLGKADVCLSFLEVNKYFSLSPPQKIFEYFAAGKPVIANNIPTHTDYIVGGHNGIIINLDSIEFRDAVLRLFKDRTLLKKLSENARNSRKNNDMAIVEDMFFRKTDELLGMKNN